MFERVEYTVARIDGDYAYLQRVGFLLEIDCKRL